MQDRLYFLLGDIASNALVGAVCGYAGVAWMPHALGFWGGMLVSMVLSMLFTMVASLTVLLHYFGAMEVMIPTMLGGMAANMLVCVLAHFCGIGVSTGILVGTGVGLVVLAATATANTVLTRVPEHG